MHLLKLGLRPWKLSPWNQLAASASVGVLLVLSGGFFSLYGGLGPAISRLKSEQVLSVYASSQVVTKEQETALFEKVRDSFTPESITEIEWVGVDAFLERIRSESPALFEELSALGSERNAIVPRYVSVSGSFADEQVAKLKSIAGVESIDTSRDRHQGVIGAFEALRWVCLALFLGIVISLFSSLGNVARINRTIQAELLSLLRLLGAGKSRMLAPLLVGGVSVGLLGGGMAWIVWWIGGSSFIDGVRGLTPALTGVGIPPVGLGIFLLLFGAFLGAVSGLLSSGSFRQND